MTHPVEPTADGPPALVIQTSFVGDVVLTTPLLALLAERGPVDVVVTPAGAFVLANNPGVRAVIPYDKRGDARGMAGLWRTSQALKSRFRPVGASGFGGAAAAPVAYLAQSSIRSAVLGMLVGCRERVGFASSAARSLCTRTVPYREDRHHAERLWRLAAQSPDAEPTAAALRPRVYPSAEDRSRVDALLRSAGHMNEPLVALAPGSAWGTKRWPHYPALAAALAPTAWVVIVGGANDREAAGAIAAAVAAAHGARGSGVIDATGFLPILAAAELIRRCAAIVTNDSAPQHLASAVGTPTVTVFGPTVPEFGFGPLAPRHACAGHTALDCRPCDRHGPQRCPLGHWRCMREITVAEIERLVREVAGPALTVPHAGASVPGLTRHSARP